MATDGETRTLARTLVPEQAQRAPRQAPQAPRVETRDDLAETGVVGPAVAASLALARWPRRPNRATTAAISCRAKTGRVVVHVLEPTERLQPAGRGHLRSLSDR